MFPEEPEMPELLALSYPLLQKGFGFILALPHIPVKGRVGISSGACGRPGEGCTDICVLIFGIHGCHLMTKIVCWMC